MWRRSQAVVWWRFQACATLLLAACGAAPPPEPRPQPPPTLSVGPSHTAPAAPRCSGELSVRFYDVGQGLAALVTLDDGRKILVDTGEDPARAGCGAPCRAWHDHLITSLARDLAGRSLDALWITHQHSDHHGGASPIITAFRPALYVDNGRRLDTAGTERARSACETHAVPIHVVDPSSRSIAIAPSRFTRLTPVLPATWPSSCRANENDCSIALRIDFCESSILFTGDAEADAEHALALAPAPALDRPVTLLQVGHHGSDTSTTDAFLARTRPKYAVISSAKPGVGTNRTYCHPRAATVNRLSAALGGATSRTLRAFDASASVKCRNAGPEHWIDVPASDRLFATARDGDVVLTTTGDGTFRRQ